MKPVLIVIAPYYTHLAAMLQQGAMRALQNEGIAFEILEVPGAFEIPAAIAFAAGTQKYSGYVALGAVIRGETTHYDYVCEESARGLQQLAVSERLAIGYGILTCENEAQAIVRADPAQGNKGGFAAQTCVRMLRIKEGFGLC